MNDTVSVSLLGPVEVRVGGRTTPLVGIKQQSLLAMLALAVPQPVSDDRLIEELWGDEQPANPSNALQALVSQLRRLLGPRGRRSARSWLRPAAGRPAGRLRPARTAGPRRSCCRGAG